MDKMRGNEKEKKQKQFVCNSKKQSLHLLRCGRGVEGFWTRGRENQSFPFTVYLIKFWMHWVFIAAWAFLQLSRVGATLQLVHKLLPAVASLSAKHELQGTWAQELQLPDSRAQTQQLWHRGLVALKHVGSSQTRDQTRVSCIGRQIFATESLGKPSSSFYEFSLR